jgi:uncharacterized protein
MYKVIFVILVFISTLSFAQKEAPINSVELFNRGFEFYSKGEYEEALAQFEKIDRNDTNYVLALVKKSLIYLQLEKYEDGIKVCKEGLSLNSDEEYTFYVNLGVFTNKVKRPKEALDIFDEALKKYPKSYMIYYNKGVVYKTMEKIPEAIQMYKETILLNPHYPNAHLNLGAIAADEGKITQAVLCYNMFIMLQPNTSLSLAVLQRLNEIVTSKYEKKITGVALSPEGGDDFSEMDLIISNYAALSKGFKVPGKIDLPIVKQSYALFSKLEYDKNDKGFWMQTYVPFFKEVFKQEKFEVYAYFSVQSSKNEEHIKLVKKKEADILAFSNWAEGYIDRVQEVRMTEINGKRQEMHYWYDENKHSVLLISNTNPQNGKLRGYSEYYFSTGMLSSKGIFDENGDKQGLWTFYYFNGSKSQETNFNNGLMDGAFKLFYKDGTLKSEGKAVNGKLQGQRKDYNKAGLINSIYYYKDDQQEGKFFSYLANGDKDYEAKYEKGNLTDSLCEYYFANQLASVKMQKNNLNNGPIKTYYRSGKLSSEVNGLNGLNEGEYKSYYENGQLKNKGRYSAGIQVGVWKNYFSNGIVSDESPFDEKGKLTGIYKEYDEDGKIFSELDYVKNGITGYRYYDKSGKIFKEGKKEKGTFEYKGYHLNGVLKAEGIYTVEGKKGRWKYYDQYKNLYLEEDFTDKGMIDGKARNYYQGGDLKDETSYKDGLQDGYFASYYRNGKLEREGWFVNGISQGYFNSYYPDGTIELKNYYVKNNLKGYQQHFTVRGKLDKEEVYNDGFLEKTIFYDTLGAVTETVELKNETGTFITHFNNGKESLKGPYVLGIAHGKFIWYHYNGKVSVEGNYYYGKKNDIWKWYDEDGKLITEGSYSFKELDGKWKHYYPDGKLKSMDLYDKGNLSGERLSYYENEQVEFKKKYKDNEEEGEAFYYDETGALQMVRKYKKGIAMAYSYLGSDGKLVPFIDILGGTAKCVSYYQNGNKSREYEMIKGYFQGKFIEYFSNGKIHEAINYLDDVMDGDYREYYFDGKIKAEKNYKVGSMHGPCNYYYPNGKAEKELKYNYGLLHGVCNYFNENGKLIKTQYYNSDVIIKEINY